jgi:membrane-associated phospholipid phosphatase
VGWVFGSNSEEAANRETTGRLWETPGGNWLQGQTADTWEQLRLDINLIKEDYGNYYTGRNLGLVAAGIAVAAPVANTSADSAIRRWYQERARGESVDTLAEVINYGGQLWVLVPVGLEIAALTGWAAEDYRTDAGLYEWGNRSLRAIAVGFPPVVALYALLGSSRPDREDSRWHPFRDIHGVSGHTFMGAVPFLTAAALSDDPLLKCPLILGSFLTGWSRIHEDRHYFSQVALGWWLAYLAVRTVDRTQAARSSCTVTPTVTPDGPGIAFHFQY